MILQKERYHQKSGSYNQERGYEESYCHEWIPERMKKMIHLEGISEHPGVSVQVLEIPNHLMENIPGHLSLILDLIWLDRMRFLILNVSTI